MSIISLLTDTISIRRRKTRLSTTLPLPIIAQSKPMEIYELKQIYKDGERCSKDEESYDTEAKDS